jgi:formylglycine-generating enzyme required for sulfatase activity
MIVAVISLWSPSFVLAQTTGTEAETSGDDNLSEANLEEGAEPVRRIQRLGDPVGENEYELELSVPQAEGSLPDTIVLPDSNQQQKLKSLLTQLASNPGDQATLNSLGDLLADVARQANAAVDTNQLDLARRLLGVMLAVNPTHFGIKPIQERLVSLGQVQGKLEAARLAMADGRVDQPEDNCAWHFYRQVLDQDPENEEARQGLLLVQQDMIARSIAQARALELDSAERLLEDASYVREEQDLVEEARNEIGKIKTGRAEKLESASVQAMDAGDFSTAEALLIDLVALGGQGDLVNQLRRRLEEARIYGGFRPGQVIRDHFMTKGIWAPESVVILAGSFQMGSAPGESGRSENEGPHHRVTFPRGFAIGLREVSVGDFRVFVSNTGYRTDAQHSGSSVIYDTYSGRLTEKSGINWEDDFEGKPADPNFPVIHVSWNDAQAYASWLARGTGKSYRLPSESEFEYALRGGRTSRFWWGDGSPSGVVENITGEKDVSRTRRRWSVSFADYSDRYWGPAPVGSFQPNPFGLMDIGGNVAEWTRDCWHDSYIRAPADGAAWSNPGCDLHVIRGGYWASSPDQTRAAYRLYAKPSQHDARVGFRVARDL